MKRTVLLMLLAVLVPALTWAEERGDRNRGGNVGGDGFHQKAGRAPRVGRTRAVRPNVVHPQRAAVAPQFRSMGVHSYPKPIARGNLLPANREHSAIVMPNRGLGGTAIHANVIARTNFSGNPTVRAHMAIVTGAGFRGKIVGFNAHENIANHYYWHASNGFNYCHYYDAWGYHWYGWYLGSNYFWTRYYSNHFWWYDPTYYRWCYWHDGGWWWQDPDTTTIYIYNNGNYVSSNESSSANTAAPQSSMIKSADYFSKDSSREVKVATGGDAFLYDISGDSAFKPIYLGSNVTEVKFSNTNNGGAMQIMLMLKDGTFSTFDRDGSPIGVPETGTAVDDQNGAAPGADSADPGTPPQPPPSGANPPPAPAAN